MGKAKAHSLLKLGLKRAPKRHYINCGFGNGYYVHIVQKADASIVEVREYTDGSVDEVPVKTWNLKNFGFFRDEKSGRIYPLKKKVI